ncbi:MAG: sigma-70 factor domain-containing protein, partial [Gammaproteobacteria bacterium]
MARDDGAVTDDELEFEDGEALLEEAEGANAATVDDSGDTDTEEVPQRFLPGEVSQGDMDATRLYLNEIGFSPLLTAAEEVMFARRALRGDEAARKRMIESNLRLVVKIARRY